MSCVLTHDALRRGSKRVLEPAELHFPASAVVGVIGENGAGKSTLFLALADALRRGNGTARITLSSGSAHVCFMPQEPALPPWLTVREAIELWTNSAIGDDISDRLQVGALLPRFVGSLSGGEQQAVALAAVIARAGDILVLDEPFAHLDFRRRLAAIELLSSQVPKRTLTLVSSQNAADLAAFCTWYLVLAGGRVAFHGSIGELLGSVPATAAHRVSALEGRLVELLDMRREGDWIAE